ncbi:LysR substrate-binding domain-containing protein [Paraburkholderia metrosideri]|uniref:HTH-type transcriptional regulator GbpR n=1 Tax=Paraburkholderia metrosideri TaxID=580937 RepID=A0ABN7ID90_9BURK|nr:LysR substrate-binding domain-containing protein [Paraburkholderia metrosideri]CAD6559554.1 HTH-type transcriptional regulator GbpR [Paraburkholderia metrosideri]
MSQLDWYLTANLKARHLRLILAVNDFGNLSEVASNSFITVSAVSKALSEIESALGVKLFERTVNGLRPTAYGECVVRHARVLLSGLGRVAEEIKALQTGQAGKVHIGALPSLIPTIMPKALVRLKQQSPHANVSIFEGPMTTLLQELRRGELDLVVGRLPNQSAMVGLQGKVLMYSQVRLVTGPNHPLVGKKTLRWKDLQDFPWVLPPPGSLLREPIESTFARNGMSMPLNYIETLSAHLSRAYIQSEDAIALYTIDIQYPYAEVSPIHVLPLDPGFVRSPLGAAWRADKPLVPSAMLMLSCLEEVSPLLLSTEAEHSAGLVDTEVR